MFHEVRRVPKPHRGVREDLELRTLTSFSLLYRASATDFVPVPSDVLSLLHFYSCPLLDPGLLVGISPASPRHMDRPSPAPVFGESATPTVSQSRFEALQDEHFTPAVLGGGDGAFTHSNVVACLSGPWRDRNNYRWLDISRLA